MSESNTLSEINYQNIFESMPELYLVLNSDFSIVGVSNSYLKARLKTKEEILGNYLFEQFPENPEDPEANGIKNLKNSLHKVITEKVVDIIDIIKYDILTENSFESKYWKMVNSPIFAEDGLVKYILHKAEDITEIVLLKKQENNQIKINETLKIQSDTIEDEFKQIAVELKTDHLSSKKSELVVNMAIRQLEIERAKFLNLLKNAPAYISLLETPEHIFTFTNPLYQKLINDRQVIGKNIREASPELEGQGFYEFLDQVYQSGEPYIGKETPAMIDTGNGKLEQKYMDFVYQPIFDIDNKVNGISAYSYDVTELVVARQKLEALTQQLIESESKYKSLSESLESKIKKRTAELISEQEKLTLLLMNSPAIIAVLEGSEHVYTLSNPLYQKVTGNRNIIGKPIKEALPELEGQGLYEKMDEVYNTGKPFFANEFPVLLDVQNNGLLQTVYFNFVYQPIFNVNKQVEAVSIFAFDITEQVIARKEVEKLNNELLISEAKYKNLSEKLEIIVQERTRELSAANQEIEYQRNKLYSLLMNAPTSICLLEGPEHVFSLANPLYQQLFGKDLIGKPIREALPFFEEQGYFELLDKVYKTGEPLIGNESPAFFDKTGNGELTECYFNFVYQPVYNNDKVEGISAFIYEVTEQVTARQQLEKLNGNLKRSNEELQSFAYIASHDLQEPLRTLTSYSQLLLLKYKDKIDNDANEYINFIISATQRMKTLIEDVLSHSKIHKKEGSKSVTDLNYILGNIENNLKIAFEENKVTLNYENLPSVKAEATFMLQLFQNLISNAVKYKRKDVNPVININVNNVGKEWLFSISDNGIGIEPQYKNRIFEIFKRLHGREEYEGTGIGLASCKKIVELYGGKIWVESAEGKGATFFFTIPV